MAMTEPWPDLAGRIEGRVHLLPVRIYYEDTDFSGVVYHANYLRYMERGRSDFLRLAGIHHAALHAGEGGEPMAFAVRHMAIDFLKPARIDDVLTVESRLHAVSGAAMQIDQRVLRAGDVLIGARVKAALVNGQGRPCRMPAALRALLLPFLEAEQPRGL